MRIARRAGERQRARPRALIVAVAFGVTAATALVVVVGLRTAEGGRRGGSRPGAPAAASQPPLPAGAWAAPGDPAAAPAVGVAPGTRPPAPAQARHAATSSARPAT